MGEISMSGSMRAASFGWRLLYADCRKAVHQRLSASGSWNRSRKGIRRAKAREKGRSAARKGNRRSARRGIGAEHPEATKGGRQTQELCQVRSACPISWCHSRS